MSEYSTLPCFVGELDRLSDELELFGLPRMLPPKFMPNVYPNGMAEMEAVKVLDLLHSLMDSLWALLQSRHRDRSVQMTENEEIIKLRCEKNTLDTEVQNLEIKLKKKNHELRNVSSELFVSRSHSAETTADLKRRDATIATLKSKLKQLQSSTATNLVLKDIEICQLKEKLKQSLGLGISHGSRRPSPSESLQVALEQVELLKDVILKYQETNDVLVSQNLALLQEKTEGTLETNTNECPEMETKGEDNSEEPTDSNT